MSNKETGYNKYDQHWQSSPSVERWHPLVDCPYCRGAGVRQDTFAKKINDTAHQMGVHRLRTREERLCSRCRGLGLVAVEHKEAMLAGDRLKALRLAHFATIHEFSTHTGLPSHIISMAEEGRFLMPDFYQSQQAIERRLSHFTMRGRQ